MRIASLVPSATEALFALGLGEQVVAVTHECDFPTAARSLPHLTRSLIEPGLDAGEIDARVRELVGRGEALYALDEPQLAELAPDLVVTQAVCEVCAVSYDDVKSVAERLPTHPAVLSLDPTTLGEVLTDLEPLAEAAGAPGNGDELRGELERRLDAVREAVAGLPRPRVAALEWLDPPYVAGHWVPEMVATAGGEDVLGEAGGRSRTAEWDELAAARPDVAVVMPCGLYVDESMREAVSHQVSLEAIGADRVVAVDAASSFSRPGPRLIEGVELLGHLLHPSAVDAPPSVEYRGLRASTRNG
jgi:iron complex transport system substrate-binding protein